MDLSPLLYIIRNPGTSIKDLAQAMGVTDRHASKIAIGLHSSGDIVKKRDGKLVLLFPDPDSERTSALGELVRTVSASGGVTPEDLIVPGNNLRLVNVLASGPLTVNMVTECLGISRPTFYRMLKGFGPEACGIIDVRGRREKEYFLVKDNWLYPALVSLARAVCGPVELPRAPRDFKKLHLTSLRPRIILSLGAYLNFHDSFVVPKVLTQQGLARAMWTTQPIISKELNRLIERGMVEQKRQHVKNEKRMYKTYHLTSEGIKEAERLRGMLESTSLPVVDFNGVRAQRPMNEVPALFSMRIQPVEILNYMSDYEVLNFNQFQKLLATKRESDFISVLHRLPRLKYFFGRDTERYAFKKWLGEEEPRVFFLKGIAGMGKTTFLTKVIQENKQNWNIFFYSIKEWSTPRNIISHMVHFLERLKRTGISGILEGRGEFNMDEAMLLLEEPFHRTRALLIFDDVQKADERIIDFFKALLRSQISDEVKLVIAGRELLDLQALVGKEGGGEFGSQELSGLEKAPSEQLLAGRGIHRSKFDAIYDYTGGHPLALELVEAKNGLPDMNLKMFIREEIVPRLSGEETEILRFVSIFRYPFTADAVLLGPGSSGFEQGGGLGFEDFPIERPPEVKKGMKHPPGPGRRKKRSSTEKMIQRLVKRSFLIQDSDSYYLHDIFRDFFYKRMDDQTRKRFHSRASEYYERMDNDPAWVESIYHQLSAGSVRKAANSLTAHGDSLIKRGFSEELKVLFKDAKTEGLPVITRLGYDYYMGEIGYMLGDWEEAIARFRSSIDGCRELDLEVLTTRAMMRIARIHSLMGKQEEALKEYAEVTSLAKKLNQFLLESDAVKQAGSRYYFMGNMEKLKEHHRRALEIANRTKSRECLANAHFLNTFLTKLSGDYEQCEKLHRECLAIYEELGNQAQALMVINNLGDLYYTMERFDDALEMFEHLKEISESIGDLQHKGFGLVNSGDALIRLNKYPEAEVRLKEALDLFVSLKEPRLILGTQAIMANLYKAKKEPGNAREYYSKAIDGYKENNMLLDLPVFLYEYADMEESLGKRDRAEELFEQSLKYAKQMDNRSWIKKSKERLKRLK